MSCWAEYLHGSMSILNALVGASIGTFAVTGTMSLYQGRQKRRALASYTAMRLAIALEGYTYSCWKLIIDNQNAETAQDYEFPDWDTDLPAMPQYPDDADGWRALDIELADQALGLRNRIEAGQAAIYAAIEFEEDKIQDVVEEQASRLGVDAWNVAGKLRQLHDLNRNESAYGDAAHALVAYRERAAAARLNKNRPIAQT